MGKVYQEVEFPSFFSFRMAILSEEKLLQRKDHYLIHLGLTYIDQGKSFVFHRISFDRRANTVGTEWILPPFRASTDLPIPRTEFRFLESLPWHRQEDVLDEFF